MTDNFTRWSDAIAMPDTTAPEVARTLDERMFCYISLLACIHRGQETQFESAQMSHIQIA